MCDSFKDTVALHAAAVASAQGSRPSQQDRYTVVTPEEWPKDFGDTLALFGVFDGHGSDSVSEHASENLFGFLLESDELEKGNYEQAMQEAVEKEDRALFEELNSGQERFVGSGSTVSLVLINFTKGVLVVGNLGDSHVIMSKRDPKTVRLKSVDRLTKSHKPGNPQEKQRIEEAGGQVQVQQHVPRIGALDMSRALGDLEYKNPLNNSSTPVTRGQARASGSQSGDRENFLSIQMSFNRIELRDDEQYVLALTTDGVTNAMEDKIIMHSMNQLFNSGMNAEEVARSMVKESSARLGSDNATCIAVFLNGYSAAPY